MLRVLIAFLLTVAPFMAPTSNRAGGGTSDGNDEWQCDGNPGEHCNPKY